MSNFSIFDGLARKTFENPRFKEDYFHLLNLKFAKQKMKDFEKTQIKNMLETAALFALSENEDHKKLALKIVVFLYELYGKKFSAIPVTAELVFARMGDIPAIATMIHVNKEPDIFTFFSDEDDLSTFVKFPEILAKKTINYIEIGTKKHLLTDFQTLVFQDLQDGENVTFTAPTSAGKSFIVQQYIAEKVLDSQDFCALYVVPTRSLIAEIREQLTGYIRELGVKSKDAMIFNSADYANIDIIRKVPKKVIVLTQERLLQLLSNDFDLKVDLLVIDEAQKINDESRGIIIEDSVQELLNQTKFAKKIAPLQKIIISPNKADPHRFTEIFKIMDGAQVRQTTKTPVGQNLFFADFKRGKVDLSLFSQELRANLHLATYELESPVPASGIQHRKVWLVKTVLREGGHSLVYCNYPSECVKVADGLADFTQIRDSEELDEAADFIASHVHPLYYLVEHLRKGIGYHYGRMPHFVRVRVKRLFEDRKIDYLCCTSTLLEGVNLPAKNIVLFKPKIGKIDPMDKGSVLNLAGRAGRLLKDYYGNIYCIDFEKWESPKDIFDGKLEPVKSVLERTFTEDIDELISHLGKYEVQPQGRKNIETVATSLLVRQLKDPTGRFLRDIRVRCPSVPAEKFDIIGQLLEEIALEVNEIKDIVLQNRSIDPRLQFELYKVVNKERNLVLPLDPARRYDPAKTFYYNLSDVFGYVAKYITLEENDRYQYYALIASWWLRHVPYHTIIRNNIEHEEEELKRPLDKKEVNEIITEIDKVVEDTLKFQYSRGLKCYIDILTKIMANRKDLRTFCADLPSYLEAGASDGRIFILLSAGISRNVAVEIYHDMPRDVRDIASCLAWLKKDRNKLRGKLHSFMFQEIDDVIGLDE
jgi:hypothetical protein